MKETDQKTTEQTRIPGTPDIQTQKKSAMKDTHGDFYFAFPKDRPAETQTIELILRDLNKYSLMM